MLDCTLPSRFSQCRHSMDICPTWSPSRAGTLDKTFDTMSNVEQYMSVEIGGAPAAPPLKRLTDPRAHLLRLCCRSLSGVRPHAAKLHLCGSIRAVASIAREPRAMPHTQSGVRI